MTSSSASDGKVTDGEITIAFDALAARFGGTAQVVISLAKLLAADPRVGRLIVVVTRDTITANGLAYVPDISLLEISASGFGGLPRRLLWETCQLPSLVTQENVSLLVSFSGMLPRHPRCPIVCELLNPVPLRRKRGVGVRLRRWAMRRTARQSTVIHAPTEAQAKLLREQIGGNVRIMPHGVDPALFTPAANVGTDVLYVSDFHAHKRHDLMIAAWTCMPAPRPRLRLIGDPGPEPHTYERVLRMAREASPTGITIEPRRPQDELPDVYRAARVLMMPSEHESFSMPLAEGMACGIPVVARDDSVLRETGGPGAIYISGDDPEEWAAAITQLFQDSARFERMRVAALTQARRFSWALSVEELVNLAESAMGSTGNDV
jgi:glycosyltransferase involved in cell wall biosynthesis